MPADDDLEHEIRAELSRIVASARSRRSLAERTRDGDDDTTRRQLGELRIHEILFPDNSGRADDSGRAGGPLRHILAAVEEVAVGLVAPGLLPTALAAWTGLAAAGHGLAIGGLRPALSEPIAVAWPGVLAGAEPVGPGSVSGRLGYVPGAMSARHLMMVRPGAGGATVALVALDRATREPVPVLDLSRPAAAVELGSAAVRELGRLSTVELTRVRAGWLVAVAADCLGGLRATQAAAVDYARHRSAFGRSIGSFQAVRHRCADLFVEVEATRAVLRGAIAAIDDGEDALALALAAASQAVDAFCRGAESSILVHGALGFTYECDAQFYARRAYSNAALLGGVDGLRAELARD